MEADLLVSGIIWCLSAQEVYFFCRIIVKWWGGSCGIQKIYLKLFSNIKNRCTHILDASEKNGQWLMSPHTLTQNLLIFMMLQDFWFFSTAIGNCLSSFIFIGETQWYKARDTSHWRKSSEVWVWEDPFGGCHYSRVRYGEGSKSRASDSGQVNRFMWGKGVLIVYQLCNTLLPTCPTP